MYRAANNKAMKNRPQKQKAWAGLANARLLLRRYTTMKILSILLLLGTPYSVDSAGEGHHEAIPLGLDLEA